MDLIIDFLPLILFGKRRPFYPGDTQLVFPGFGGTPIVYIGFDGILMKDSSKKGFGSVEGPIQNAIWALRVFKHNNWEVEIFSLKEEVGIAREWVSIYALDLVDRISEYCLLEAAGRENLLDRSLMDVFVGNRAMSWSGRKVDWVEIMTMLDRMGFLGKGLLHIEQGERKNDMVELLKEQIFRDLMMVVKTKKVEGNQTRGELIKSIENYIRHPGIVSSEYDLLVRARAEGELLESVLRLLARDRFDPVGCIILAQQDRELQVDQMSSLSQVDID